MFQRSEQEVRAIIYPAFERLNGILPGENKKKNDNPTSKEGLFTLDQLKNKAGLPALRWSRVSSWVSTTHHRSLQSNPTNKKAQQTQQAHPKNSSAPETARPRSLLLAPRRIPASPGERLAAPANVPGRRPASSSSPRGEAPRWIPSLGHSPLQLASRTPEEGGEVGVKQPPRKPVLHPR